MVHALKESWRVLRKNGLLIDLRPLHENVLLEALTGEESALISCYASDERVANDKAADKAIECVLSEKRFQFEASSAFQYVKFYDTGDELLHYYAERNPPIIQPGDVVERIKRANDNPAMTLRVTNPMLLNTYRRIDDSR